MHTQGSFLALKDKQEGSSDWPFEMLAPIHPKPITLSGGEGHVDGMSQSGTDCPGSLEWFQLYPLLILVAESGVWQKGKWVLRGKQGHPVHQ